MYSTAINIFQTTNIKAKAYKTGYEPSATATYNYQVLVVNNPISTLQSGYYNYGTITEAYTTTAGATIRYTINGTTPNEFSTIYAAPIMIDHNFTLNLIAYKTGYAPSQVVTYNYTTGNAPQNLILSFTFQEVESQTVINNDYNIINIIIPYGVNRSGLTPIIIVEEGCTVYPESGISQSFINSVNYTVSSVTGTRNYTVTVTNSPAVYPPEASIDGGNYSQPITVELMTETEGAIIKYTLDGSIPNLRTSQTYTSPITISSSKTLKAKAYLYVGPTFGSPLDNRGTASVKSLSDLLEATIIWESSELMTENYTITRKNNNKVKAEKKLIPTQEMNK
ncbi:MAG: chitobiase/beta-hexosaminidase C-terminal domain-containing protein [archaeon]